MSAPKPNAELAYKVLDHIDAHPEQWDQGLYIGKAECGTIGCFAGWACMLSGEKPSWLWDGQTDTSYVGLGGNTVFAGERAEQLLGIDRYIERDHEYDREDLFGSGNTREDLGRLVAEIFGPRPDAAS